MPAGVDNPELGAVAFGAIKLVGYCFAAHMISKRYEKTPSSWFAIGLSRTLIGIAFGYPYYSWGTSVHSPYFLPGLVPIRLIEWLLLIIMFYDRRVLNWRRALGVASAGTAWSFFLDLPAIFGYILVAGFWIC
jgi:hypothetical protein